MIRITTASLPGQGGRPYKSLPRKCNYLISVGKEHFRDGYLKSTLALISSEFEECTLIITGTLQRFNIEALEGETRETAYKLSLKREIEFIEKVSKLIQDLESSCKFILIPWDKYREKKFFKTNLKVVEDLLIKKKVFSEAMTKTVNQYCEKHSEEEAIFDKKLFIKNSKEFLKEECAAMFFWPMQLTLYPSGATPILFEMSKYINFLSHTKTTLSWQKIKFKNKRIKENTVITKEKTKDHLDTAILQVKKINIIYAPTIFKKRKLEIDDKFKLCSEQLRVFMKLILIMASDKSEINDYLLITLNEINEFKENIESYSESIFKEKNFDFK